MANNCFTRVFALCVALAVSWAVYGQDVLPGLSHPDVKTKVSKPVKTFMAFADTIKVTNVVPELFKQTKANRIEDFGEELTHIMTRLRMLRMGMSEDSLRILHIGDSHVRGRLYPQTVGEKLTEAFGAIIYTDMGVNGATTLTFTHPERINDIAAYKPELIILSFGTNESHNKRYNATIHYHQMDELITLIHAKLPDVSILLTTPPGQYESFRQSRRRRTYAVNPRTHVAAKTICQYGKDKKMAIWDMFTILGGKDLAAKNWWTSGMMRPDHIHYLPDAYVLQGGLLYEALINAYNDYVSD